MEYEKVDNKLRVTTEREPEVNDYTVKELEDELKAIGESLNYYVGEKERVENLLKKAEELKVVVEDEKVGTPN